MRGERGVDRVVTGLDGIVREHNQRGKVRVSVTCMERAKDDVIRLVRTRFSPDGS